MYDSNEMTHSVHGMLNTQGGDDEEFGCIYLLFCLGVYMGIIYNKIKLRFYYIK